MDAEAQARETEHRVKNTLQLISSVILLHSRRAPEPAAQEALKAALQRVTAVSVAHRHVERVDGVECVDVAALVRELAADLASSSGPEGVEIALELDPLVVPGRNAAPIGLLVSEALGNALRHAFPAGRLGRVVVAVRCNPDGFELSVTDDGVGEPPGGIAKGFGMTVIQLLAQQLKGKLTAGPAQPGFRLAVQAPMDTAKPSTLKQP
jgi:two-component sensor histidine kinase